LPPSLKPRRKPASSRPSPACRQTRHCADYRAGERPKFDFYKILPGTEEPVTERELRERLRANRRRSTGSPPRTFISFRPGRSRTRADADNQKARLAILGFESSVEPANLPDKGTWYRVRMGPYQKLDEINRIRQSLAQNASRRTW